MPKDESIKRALNAIENDPSKVLGLTLNGKSIKPKQHIPKAEAQDPPTISFAVPNPNATYLVICLDLDAPFISAPFLGPILHWNQPGLKAAPDGTLTSSEPFICNWGPPGPPPGAAPHRYVFFLYEQPADFDAKKYGQGKPVGIPPRVRWSLDKWQASAKLGDLIAASYFTSN